MKHLKLSILLAALLLPATTYAENPTGTSLSAPGGRFVFGQISTLGRDQFMLDTQTGRLWQFVCGRFNKEEPAGPDNCLAQLEPVKYANLTQKWLDSIYEKGEYSYTPPAAPVKK